MPRSGLTRLLREIHAVHREAASTLIPIDEVLDLRRERREATLAHASAQRRAGTSLSRRTFLRGAAGLGAGLLLGGATGGLETAAGSGTRARALRHRPRLVIVGSGLAGLRCAERLRHHGLASTVYEAATDHVGGRCWTNRGFFGDGIIGEHGGEFISSEHHAVRELAKRLGLGLEDINGGALPGHALSEIYWMDGAPYTLRQALDDWAGAFRNFHAAGRAAPFGQSWDHHSREGARLDHLSVSEFVEDAVPGGTHSRLGRLLMENAISEYGADPSAQSSLNLIALMQDDPRTDFTPLAGTDERYHIRGGNDQLVSGLVAGLPPDTVRAGQELIAVRHRSDGSYVCTFRHGLAHHDVPADHLVLALPFTKLREVEVAHAGLSALKLRAIRHLRLGTNAKLVLELEHRTWGPEAPSPSARPYNGTSYSGPAGFEVVWDGRVGHGPKTLLVDFLGARQGAELGEVAHGAAPASDVDRFLRRIEPLYPGTRAAWTGRAWNDTWAKDPWHYGAYSYWGVGQTTGFGGYEGVQEGRIHFAGEHTSAWFQGYMEGAVVSGRRAADEILGQA
jgi:monoamine oxidase